jgi:hypothetical protein
MKYAGIFIILLLIPGILFCGCVQVIINPPGTPGYTAPAATTTPAQPVPVDTTVAVVTTLPAKASTPVTGATLPRFIVPVGDPARVGHRSFTFYYGPATGQKTYTITVPVNMSVYYGAGQMKVGLPPNDEDPEAIKAYIESYGKDPAMEELYDDVLSELRSARYRSGSYLNDDEYMEMIVAFVQQIPYKQNPSEFRKYPIQVIYDKAGDSDEKSQLLAKLLSHEGYDVSLMVFENRYETTGIRVIEDVPDASLKVFSDGKKSYAFVDAATPRFIGSIPADFKSSDDPAIYPVGSGTKSYGPINYVWKVVADLDRMNSRNQLTVDMPGTVIRPWDKTGTCMWIKNSKLLTGTTCYCCDM